MEIMHKVSGSTGDGAVSLRCRKLGGTMVPAEHLLEFDYGDDCQEKYRCNKCGVFRKDLNSGKICKVLILPSESSSRDRSVQEVMKRTHGCNATRKKIFLRVVAGMR